MSTTSLQPTKVSQPLGGKQIQNSKGKNIKSPSVCRDGNANPAYHPWEASSVNKFLTGGKTQCGRKSTYHCNLKTVRWIKGYRNTCPIAGCCGTFNRPAPLELHNFNFKAKGITKKIKINKVHISYQHHVTGVDVGVGKGSEKKSWAGDFPYVDIILYKNNTKIQTIRHNKSVPLAKNGTVNATFTKTIASFNPAKDDLKIEINYAANGGGKYETKATNPSILYATGLSVKMNYEYIAEPKITLPPVKEPEPEAGISGTQSANSIITDPRMPKNAAGIQNCRTTLTHTINIKNTKASDIVVTKPDGVTYTRTINKSKITYVYQDTSGKSGTKTIKYTLKSDKKKTISKTYNAVLYTHPTATITKQYIKNQKFHTGDKFIIINGKCWNNVKIYVDGNKKSLINWNYVNPLTVAHQQEFLTNINKLSCGWHKLYVYFDNIHYKTFDIQITAPQVKFTSTLKGTYSQNKHSNVNVTITRTDSIELQDANGNQKPISLTIIDTANKTNKKQVVDLLPHESCIQEINIYYPGTFELKYTYHDGCKEIEKTFGKFTVTPTHIQSYDKLLIRTNNTPIEYESIVIRHGDNQRKPITYQSARLVDSMDDFILFGKDGLCNIGDLGYGILAVHNRRLSTIKNLCIELNPLIKSEDEYEDFNPLIMEWQTGMLQNFVDNFFVLNPQLRSIINIFNIQNKDLINEGTENVVLQITEIQADELLEIKIPYSSPYIKEIYMNFLVLGEPQDFMDIDAFDSIEEAYGTYEQYMSHENPSNRYASNTSKMSERECMCISLSTQDLRPTELYIDGDLDKNDLSDTDDLDIRYRIQIPESECDEESASSFEFKTKIINDARLIPTGYSVNGNKIDFDIYDEHDNIRNKIEFQDSIVNVFRGIKNIDKPMVGKDVFLRYIDKNNQNKYIRTQTNNKGIAYFNYTIPEYYQNTTDINLEENTKIKYHLEEILNTIDIFYQGDDFYNEAKLFETKHPTIPTKINFLGFIYYLKNDDTPKFVSSASINSRLIHNISTIYAVGQLIDVNNDIGINDEIISLSYINDDITLSQKGISGIHSGISTLQNKEGLFQIRLRLKQESYDLLSIRDDIHISYDGSLFYDKSHYGDIIESYKNITKLTHIHDYNVYYRGETIKIAVKLFAEEPEFFNTVDIIQNGRCKQTIHMFYKTCSAKNTEAFKTIYKTNSDKLLPNSTEANIYCGVDTDLKILARLQKKVIENHDVNVLTINAINGYKPNKNVVVKAMIGANANKQRLGDYLALTAIDIDKEKYSYDQSSDIIYWKIGDMDSYETQKCNILLEAEEIGHNMIYVCGFDYLHEDKEKTVNTFIDLSLLEDDKNTYYVGDIVPLKAVLTASDIDTQNNNIYNIYGQVKFVKQVYDESIQDYGAEIVESISNVSTFNNEHYAKTYTRLNNPQQTKIKAVYEGAKILSINYQNSESNEITFNNINKYDTIVRLTTEQQVFITNQNINISGMILYNPHNTEDDGDNILIDGRYYDKYFDKKLDIKFFVENKEITNISYVNNQYDINFIITQPGEYLIKAFIPNTDKTEESSHTILINVIDGENNE